MGSRAHSAVHNGVVVEAQRVEGVWAPVCGWAVTRLTQVEVHLMRVNSCAYACE